MTEERIKPEWKAQKTEAQNRIDSRVKATLPPLTPAEAARPFARYFYDEIRPCDPAHYAMMDEPMDPARAFLPTIGFPLVALHRFSLSVCRLAVVTRNSDVRPDNG